MASTSYNLSNQEQSVNTVQLGQYTVTHRTNNVNVTVTVDPLTQEEMAEGWQQVLPRSSGRLPQHHFSVYLSQLPPHLWSRLDRHLYGKGLHGTIRNRIYSYSVRSSKYDDTVMKLYDELNKTSPNKDVVSRLYSYLDRNRVKGWIMIRAKNFLN